MPAIISPENIERSFAPLEEALRIMKQIAENL